MAVVREELLALLPPPPSPTCDLPQLCTAVAPLTSMTFSCTCSQLTKIAVSESRLREVHPMSWTVTNSARAQRIRNKPRD